MLIVCRWNHGGETKILEERPGDGEKHRLCPECRSRLDIDTDAYIRRLEETFRRNAERPSSPMPGTETMNSPETQSRHSVQRLVRRPRGRIPADTKAWLAVNESDCGWQIAVCKCGGWFHRMDHLAPYHTEMNWCPTCKHKPDWNGPDAENQGHL
jgi:uncharacterized protein YlaI